MALSSLLADYWILPPAGFVATTYPADIAGLVFLAGTGVLVSLKASIGVAMIDEADATWSDTLHRADAAIYLAKAEGGDRCVGMDLHGRS